MTSLPVAKKPSPPPGPPPTQKLPVQVAPAASSSTPVPIPASDAPEPQFSTRPPPRRSNYAASTPLEVRRRESQTKLKQYPNRVPVILERRHDDKVVPELDLKKFMVPGNSTVSGFLCTIRKRVRLTAEQAIFLFVDNTLPSVTMSMSQLHHDFQAEDGFLYITYSGESTFGGTA